MNTRLAINVIFEINGMIGHARVTCLTWRDKIGPRMFRLCPLCFRNGIPYRTSGQTVPSPKTHNQRFVGRLRNGPYCSINIFIAPSPSRTYDAQTRIRGAIFRPTKNGEVEVRRRRASSVNFIEYYLTPTTIGGVSPDELLPSTKPKYDGKNEVKICLL